MGVFGVGKMSEQTPAAWVVARCPARLFLLWMFHVTLDVMDGHTMLSREN